jgi:hypothetical protein
MTDRSRRRSQAPTGFDLWAPRITRILGWGGVIFATIFWSFTGRIEPYLLGLFGTFATGGELLAAWRDFRLGLRRVLEESGDEDETKGGP